MLLSIVCPIYNEEKYISVCIKSILAQDFPKDDLEVIFADGMSTDGTRRIVSSYAEKFPFIRMIDNPKRIAPAALNTAISVARGDIVMRLDAHATYAPNYFSAVSDAVRKYEADNAGAPCRTDVLHKNKVSLAIKEVLSNPLGVGNSSFRTGVSEAREVDTVPFGCWPATAFEKFGRFDERLVRNQDFEFNSRIRKGGGRIVIIPDTYSVYYARESFATLADQGYKNGKWNILTVYYTGRLSSLALRHYVPLAFVLSLFVPLLAGIIVSPLAWLSLASLIAYSCAVSAVSLKMSVHREVSAPYVFAAFVSLHVSYGFGSLIGLYNCLRDRIITMFGGGARSK